MLLPIRRLVPFLLILLWPVHAAAWCLLEAGPMFRDFWIARYPELRIDVFISLGDNSSFLQTGFSLPQAEALVRRVIAMHNETVGPPYLFYVGTIDTDLSTDPETINSMVTRDPGIVIDSFSCAQPLPYPCSDNVHACATISGSLADDLVSRARVTFQPLSGDCPPFGGHTWDLDPNLGPDAAGIMLHEIGHTLGLDHTNVSPDDCLGPTDGAGGMSVMRAPQGGNFPYNRDWRRDDLEGLRVIYGDALEHAVYSWLDSTFPGNPGEATRSALCAGIRTPPALTGSVTDDGITDTQFVAFTDETDRVKHLEWDGTTFSPPAIGATIDPSGLGISFAPVAIAHSDVGGGDPARVLAIWSADESKIDEEIRVRFALRDVSGGPWAYGFLDTPDGPTQRSNDVAVGFDVGTSLFVISSITNNAHTYFVALDLQGNQVGQLILGEGVVTPPFVFDIAKASCFPDGGVSRCVVPYTDSDFDQFDPGAEALRHGWYDLELHADGGMTLIDDTVTSDFQPRGMLDLTSGPDGFRGVVGDRRYELERAPGEGATDVPALDAQAFPAGDWPLRLGSQKFEADTTTYRILARRLGKLCGNGDIDCDESCDDGNLLDSDGCSASCSIESTPTTGDPTTGSATDTEGPSTVGMTTAGPATATDTGPVADVDGCGCAARESHGCASLLMLLLGATRRRRRRGTLAHD